MTGKLLKLLARISKFKLTNLFSAFIKLKYALNCLKIPEVIMTSNLENV